VEAAVDAFFDETATPQGRLWEQLYAHAVPARREHLLTLARRHRWAMLGVDIREITMRFLAAADPSWLIENERDGTLLVRIPAGKFLEHSAGYGFGF
jgi:hypothetical protein